MIKKFIKIILPDFVLNYLTKNGVNNTNEIDIDINYGIDVLEKLSTNLTLNDFIKWIKYKAIGVQPTT